MLIHIYLNRGKRSLGCFLSQPIKINKCSSRKTKEGGKISTKKQESSRILSHQSAILFLPAAGSRRGYSSKPAYGL